MVNSLGLACHSMPHALMGKAVVLDSEATLVEANV